LFKDLKTFEDTSGRMRLEPVKSSQTAWLLDNDDDGGGGGGGAGGDGNVDD
jgi:hypothetical protein